MTVIIALPLFTFRLCFEPYVGKEEWEEDSRFLECDAMWSGIWHFRVTFCLNHQGRWILIIHLPWWRRQQVSLKHWYTSTTLQNSHTKAAICTVTALETKILQHWMHVFQHNAQICDTAPLLSCIIKLFRGKYSNSLQSTKYSLIKICSKQKLWNLIQSILWHTIFIECWSTSHENRTLLTWHACE